MTRLALRQDLTGGHIQSGKQRRGAVPLVVVGDALRVAQAQRQQRLAALQGLHLALLVDAQDDGMVGRLRLQANDIAHLVHEEGIGRQLERLGPVRL